MAVQVSKKDMAPRGVPRAVVAVVPNLCFIASGIMLCNLIPATDFLLRAGLFSNMIEEGLSEAEVRDKIMTILNVGSSVGVFVTPLIDLLAKYGGGGVMFLSLFWVITHAIGFTLLVTAKGMTQAYVGRFIQCLAFPTLSLVIPPAYGLFPGMGARLNALHCCSGDFSIAFIPLVLVGIVDMTGYSERTVLIAYFVAIFLPLGVATGLLSPPWGVQDFTRYIAAVQYKKDMITEEEYLAATDKNASKEEKKTQGFNPSVDPLIWSYTVTRSIMTKETVIFAGFFIPHFLRIKKCIMPYLDIMIYQKAEAAGVDKASADFVLSIMHRILAFGWIPGIGFGFIADAWGCAWGLMVINIIISCGYWAFQYGPYNKAISCFLCLCYALNSGCCFGAGIAYVSEVYGPRLISSLLSLMFVFVGAAALVSDSFFPALMEEWYISQDNPMGVMNVVGVLNVVALAFNAALIVFPPPGPPGPEWKAPAVETANEEAQ